MSDDKDKKPPENGEERTVFMPSGTGATTPPAPAGGEAEPPAEVEAAAPAPEPSEPAAEAAPPAPSPAPPTSAGVSPTNFVPRDDTKAIQVGDILNHIFEVKRFLARGGMGEVFEGCNVNTDERVAIKVMLPQMAADELDLLARACVEADALALSDEVWEHVAFDGRRHVPLASLPGMAERTVKAGSAGKIFSLTGWKVGWVVAPPPLIDAVARAHQFVTFTTAPNLQSAAAYGLGKDDAYFEEMRAGFAAGRDRLRAGLEAAGFAVLPAEGTYFLTVDLAASGIAADDMTFCERAVHEAGIAAIPLSPFYAEDPVRNVIRLCFAKQADVLDAGIERLAGARALFA